ncbi:MAG: tRNA (N6-isopentenyl adenosine(37)-C2)-methylthiotransferase MiaB [Endomicrobium sp.]|nr:tRNA (N6-isopentenyl adenosine(37)-C2)-methylthiotransferase MiaB [Endomicrobium sp.]
MNYLIKTLGCQVNMCDSDRLNSVFLDYGASKVDNFWDADVFILNTCSVRMQSEQKAFSYLGRIEEFKRQNSNMKIVVMGCMAERLGYSIKKRFKSVDLVIGTKDIDSSVSKIIDLCYLKKPFKKMNFNVNFRSEIVKHITIMKGCNNYCSYCVVPFVRGIEKSFNSSTIIKKCSLVVKNGVREIIFFGQNVNSYKYGNVDFSLLLRNVASIKDLERIRFMTNHPKDLSDNLINVISESSKICSHIHLPMQSASNKILQAMDRKYTYEYYLNLIEKLRFAVPNISITTDIIVGFPGETDKDFEYTLNAVKNIRFSGLYVFKYSPRPNTKAFKMIDNVSKTEKKKRHTIILKESNKISAEIVLKMLGNKYQVLIEKIDGGFMEAKTKSGHKIFLKINKKYYGKILNVVIKEVKGNSLFGDVID